MRLLMGFSARRPLRSDETFREASRGLMRGEYKVSGDFSHDSSHETFF